MIISINIKTNKKMLVIIEIMYLVCIVVYVYISIAQNPTLFNVLRNFLKDLDSFQFVGRILQSTV